MATHINRYRAVAEHLIDLDLPEREKEEYLGLLAELERLADLDGYLPVHIEDVDGQDGFRYSKRRGQSVWARHCAQVESTATSAWEIAQAHGI